MGIVHDITQRKKMQEEIQNAQKLESVGILAGGIAHDYNNLLGVIMRNLSLGKLTAKPESTIFKLLTQTEKAAHQAKKLTQQLITFSRSLSERKPCGKSGSGFQPLNKRQDGASTMHSDRLLVGKHQ